MIYKLISDLNKIDFMYPSLLLISNPNPDHNPKLRKYWVTPIYEHRRPQRALYAIFGGGLLD
jgi:hypothetical protein